jgi:hypothetical protein
MRKALLAAAVTSGAVVVNRRRHRLPTESVPEPLPVLATAPAQRRAPFLEDDGDLVEAEQDAQDAAILALLDRL